MIAFALPHGIPMAWVTNLDLALSFATKSFAQALQALERKE
jgi:hypothetical protein